MHLSIAILRVHVFVGMTMSLAIAVVWLTLFCTLLQLIED